MFISVGTTLIGNRSITKAINKSAGEYCAGLLRIQFVTSHQYTPRSQKPMAEGF